MSRRYQNDIRSLMDSFGSGVYDDGEGDMARDYAIISGINLAYPVTNNTDLILENFGPAVGVTYNNGTGVITLSIGKTYLLQAAFHFYNYSNPTTDWVGYAFVNTSNARNGFGTMAINAPATNTGGGDANQVCCTVITPTDLATSQTKVRIGAAFSNLLGTAVGDFQRSWILVQQIG